MRDFVSGPTKKIIRVDNHKVMDSESKSESLLIYVAATHAGIVNGNSRFYRPDRMQESTTSWLPKNRFPKPVLIGHNEDGQVLGRVMSARYVDESHKYVVDFPTVRDSVFYKSAADKRVGLYESIDWIVDNLQEQDEYAGLGYIELGSKITNPEGIQRVLRDEYLTVSVGFKTDSAICSICHTDWAQEDKCEHKMGELYDKKKMFIISGRFEYDELSFVNFPADPFAGVVSKDKLADSLSKYSRESCFFMGLSTKERKSLGGVKMTDSLLGHDIEFEEDMAISVVEVNNIDPVTFEAEIKDDGLVSEKAQELKKKLQTWEPETDELKTKKRSLISTLNARIKKNSWDKKTVTETPTTTAQQSGEIEAALSECKACHTTDTDNDTPPEWNMDELTEEDKLFFSDVDGIYAEMEVEMDAALADGELTDIKDAKLSSESRNKLKGGSFCGPNRSFPVPDCAHVTAARRLIGRAKVSSGTKSKILSCVSGKSSRMGCGGAKKDSTLDSLKMKSPDLYPLVAEQFSDSELSKEGTAPGEIWQHYDGLQGCYKKSDPELRQKMRNLHYAVGEHWDTTSSVEYYKNILNKQDMVVLPKQELADKETAINQLTDEKAELEKSLIASEDVKGKLLLHIKKNYATQIVMYRVLKGSDGFKDLTLEQVLAKVDELSKRHVTSLKDTVADIMSELKWNDAIVSIEAPREDKTKESGQTVNDNVQVITEPTSGPEVKDPKVVMAEASRKAQELHESLRYMTDQERRVFLLSQGYDIAKAAKKN